MFCKDKISEISTNRWFIVSKIHGLEISSLQVFKIAKFRSIEVTTDQVSRNKNFRIFRNQGLEASSKLLEFLGLKVSEFFEFRCFQVLF
jgi:hypothetical protein